MSRLGRTRRALVWVAAGVLSNVIGVAAAAAVDSPAPPAVPTGATAVRLDSWRFEVSLSPGVGGGPVDHYVWTCAADYGKTVTLSSTSSTDVIVAPWKGGTWTCKVRASGDGGLSGYSSPSEPTTLWSRPLIGSLYVHTADYTGETSATVAFYASPTEYWAAPNRFRVACSSTAGGVTRARVVTTSPATISRLTPGVAYACRVRADNDYGSTAWSVSRDVVLRPGAPIEVSAQRVGLSSIEVAFSPGPGPTPTSYTVLCGGGADNRATGVASPIVVTGLAVRRYYACYVYAFVEKRISVASDDADPVALFTAPAPPVGLTRTVDGPDKVTVGFAPGRWPYSTDEFNQVSSFVAECRSSDGGTARARAGLASPISVMRLDPGRTYQCRARGLNDQGKGPWSVKTDPFVLPVGRS